MEENKNLLSAEFLEREEKSTFDFQTIYTALILNWKWFVVSLIICLGSAVLYLRYTTPVYQAFAKLLIKDENNSKSRGGSNALLNSAYMGMISNSAGIDNEMEILSSLTLAEQAVRDLKLYVTYMGEGRIKDQLIYGRQAINVDIDPAHLNLLKYPINLTIQRTGNQYYVTGNYSVENLEGNTRENYSINKTISTFPSTISTRAGILTLSKNSYNNLSDGQHLIVAITPPPTIAHKYVAMFSTKQAPKTTTIVQLMLNDEIPQRAIDYLKQLVVCYNRQANEDKNEIARRTEMFINTRLQKINTELGTTEGQLENYQKRNNLVDLKLNAGQAVTNADTYNQKLVEANTQIYLLNSISEEINNPVNKYQPLPSNVGLNDQSATSLINKYNDIVMQRNKLLRSASETSPTVIPYTSQLDELTGSIQRAVSIARRNLEIQRNSVASLYGKYQSQIQETPGQQKTMQQIGRQQEVKAGLYLMLLQKREENSISLAATADKGRLIDTPQMAGQVSPKKSMILLIALLIGLAIPSLVVFLIQFFRYKIEGHDDVVRLTKLPILADVAVASDTAKTKADIVVHKDQNNQMEEIFRSIRTNLQFMMKEGEKVILFTSTTSGEGKTFIAANLAVSFALLEKKVVLVGLDIRKPRLAELFEIDDHHHGITNLLVKDNPNWTDIQAQILPSGINNNLDLLMAGPIPPNPTELISRISLEDIINNLKQHYDYVLIDTAPVGLVTDTLQIGRIANASVYLCRADYTPKESFRLINDLAFEQKLPNMCIVLNGVDMSKKKYGYYYGYGKYGKYARYGHYSYGNNKYGSYGNYGNYSNSHYGDKNDTSVKL
ncbi:chain length determinant protein [Hoylesella oralis ATCC 33269]|uniref:non-specific protein-tyrosine kinase n=1 Tax=Hoylesella oralis ATCC 33269 TaxID=873533 RepID=E7RS06_9BACT|nr:polysaccharide biosynthesis tyrosine autokinase [Hoylesella oralis]EFZ36007.1 chain length determinant protein [Hoylesella oralis ATCC 33269]EPH19157.1 capsular exopolysaccharide family protein [Hoylesella oralis HGA0225]SHF61895.1 capsular exopolysaccharide family [Hoylesella oralis]